MDRPPAREADRRAELHREPQSDVQMEDHEDKGPRLGQADRTDPMPAVKRSRNAPNPKRGARSGITADAVRVPLEADIPEEGWTVNNCPPFMLYNKNHLSRDCAAGIVTNGAGVVPQSTSLTGR